MEDQRKLIEQLNFEINLLKQENKLLKYNLEYEKKFGFSWKRFFKYIKFKVLKNESEREYFFKKHYGNRIV